MANNHKFKDNIELLKFIKEKDIYYTSNKYKLGRNVEIFNGLNLLEKNKKELLQLWASIPFNEMFDEQQYKDFQKKIISLADNFSGFHLIFNLFDKDFNDNMILLLKNKYISLIRDFNIEDFEDYKNNFIEDSKLLIQLLDKNLKIAKNFIQNELSQKLPISLNNEIYIKILSSKDLSDDVIEEIANFFTKEDNLKTNNLVNIIKSIDNIKCKKFILGKISSTMMIEKSMFFNDKERKELTMLSEFQKMGIFDDKDYEFTAYVQGIISVSQRILEYIKNYNISYNELQKFKTSNLKNELINKLKLLNIKKTLKEEEIKEIVENIINNNEKIKLQINLLENYLYIDTVFFSISKHSEIIELENLLEKLRNGNIDEINKNENKFKEFKNMYPEEYLKEKIVLSTSMFFVSIFNHLKKKIKNDEGIQNIFEEALKHYKTLIYLFDKIPNPKVEEEIFDVILKTVRKNNERIISEMQLIRNYFGLENLDKLKFDDIVEKLKLFSKKIEIVNIINGICLFLNKKNVEYTNFFSNLMNIKSNLSTKNINISKINEIFKELKKENLNIIDNMNKENNDYLQIFTEFYLKPQALDFLISLSEEDCRNFQEIIDESDNNFLISSDIQDLEKCRKFIDDIKADDNKSLTDKKLINIFIKNANENKNISLYFNIFFNNYFKIKELKSQKFEKIETNKTKSKNISKFSLFSLLINNDCENIKDEQDNNTFVYFEGKYESNNQENDDKNFKKISFPELLELREVSMLNKKHENKSNQKKEEEDIIKFNKKFIQNIKEIIYIFHLLEEIVQKGYHEKIQIFILLKNNETSYEINDIIKNEKFEKIKNLLNEILENMTNSQLNAYKSNETQLIRFIYGRQFSFINNCLKNDKIQKIESLLNYLTNNLYKNKIKNFIYENINNNLELNNLNDYTNVINNCNKFFKEVLKINEILIEDIYKQNILDKKYKFSGLYNFLSVESDIEEQVLSWYNLLTKNYPMASTLLICNKYTSSDEIISFMYRAILCNYNVLFMMGKIEELPYEKCQLLIELISELYTNKEKQMKSCLVFLYTDNNSEIVRQIQKIHYCEILKHDDKNNFLEENIFEGEKIEIYYSDKAGVGKSIKIKNDAEEKSKKYVYFPLGGEFNKFEVISRLKNNNLLIQEKNIVFHIDLFDTEKNELMKEFLFCILITKLYGQNEDSFYLNKEIEIKVELPFGFIDFFSKFPFLKMFKNKIKISFKDLPPLIVSNKVDSDIQIICNYLRLFKNKKIIDTDLYIPNISSPYFNDLPNKITAEIIPYDECKDLLYEYLKIDLPNYYQINNFIKILSGQLKKLSLIKSLSANILITMGKKLNLPDLTNNRYIIIDSIIKNTRFLIESSFQKLLNSQNISYLNSNIGGEFDEKKQNELAIEALSQISDIISYNNVKYPLIFFYEGIHPYFTIVSPYLPENKEYKNLLDLENVHSLFSYQKLKSTLKRYDSFKTEDFFPELKIILNLENPISKNDANPLDLNNLRDIVEYYVITADNFLKMLLILLRIRENIPVIMMGETGCGKTSLIRKLYQLMNNGDDNMKILNIHSGITNKDIIDFLYKKKEINNNMSIIEIANELERIEEATRNEFLKKGIIYNKRKLWIFLDEINTCNCLGLISELLCKHSCNGIHLPDNIVFIGACNPYRLSKIEDFDGLKSRNDKNHSKLLYTVNYVKE